MKILIVEDDYVSRLLVNKAVTKMGHETLEAEDGRKAWELFQKQAPDMIISDWMMPEMDGLDLCRRIRSSNRTTYVYIILLTAKDRTKDLVSVFEAGADDYIVKPFQPEELRSRLKSGERILMLETRRHELMKKLFLKNKKLDVTLNRLKQTQAQAVQSEKMASIGQLAAGIAHEINNPIGFIGSNLDALSDYFKDFIGLLDQYQSLEEQLGSTPELPVEIRKLLATLRETEEEIELDYLKKDIGELLTDCIAGTRRVGKIVSDLKHFAHPGNDNPMLVSVNENIESTLNVVKNELKYKATLVKEFSDIPMVKAWPQKLNQVLMNLLVNAGQAIEEKGEIHIRTGVEGGRVKIDISDTGCGIEPENISKVFDPFFTTKDVGMGTGLGLNIAYNIIKEHDGEIGVESRIGEGTCFSIILPAAT